MKWSVRCAAVAAEECGAVGEVKFICIDRIAEDIVQMPATDGVSVSGKLRAIHPKTLEDITLYSTTQRFDKTRDESCPHPITGVEVEDKAFAGSAGPESPRWRTWFYAVQWAGGRLIHL